MPRAARADAADQSAASVTKSGADMRRVASAVVAVVGVAGFAMPGATLAGASPHDVARVTSVEASARRLHVGETFRLTAGARDRASTDYVLTFIADWSQLHLDGGGVTCEGVAPDSPSADGPACEFDSFTTTTSTTTHISGTFGVTASTPRTFRITVCAASFTNPQTRSLIPEHARRQLQDPQVHDQLTQTRGTPRVTTGLLGRVLCLSPSDGGTFAWEGTARRDPVLRSGTVPPRPVDRAGDADRHS